MLYYPQLSTGTLAQYPLRKTLLKRTIVNDLPDGRTVKLADASANTVAWQLNHAGITEAEWEALKGLFLAAEGRLQTFVFLDPSDNLLRFSEALDSPVWHKDGLLALTAGVADPLGSSRATRLSNSGWVAQKISQTISAAGWFRYSYSVYVRSASNAVVTLTRRTADGQDSQIENAGPDWRRLQSSGEIEGMAEEIEFELSLPAGAVVEAFGFQAEAQPQPSPYKKTETQGGVYPATRFGDDSLTPIVVGPNDYAVQIQLVTKAGS